MIQITFKRKYLIFYISILYISCSVRNDINTNPSNGKQKIVKSYFKNGTLEYQYEFFNELLHGLAIYYYENGNIKSEAEYKEGKLQNTYKEYFPNGKLKFIIEYKNGYKDGYERWYYLSGQIKSEKQYQNDKLIGIIVRWDNNGNIIY